MRARRAGMVALLLGACGLGSAVAADICEPLRERIEAQIASTGAIRFAVIVVDTDQPVAGKVVGTCARGTRKLVYVRDDDRAEGQGAAPETQQAARPERPAQASPARRTREADIITECRDGTVVRGAGGCPS